MRYLLFFKPYRVLTDFTDPAGRATLADFVSMPGLFAAGQLDYDSEGLMVLTDDGRLAHTLTHPRHKLPKTYFVQVERVPNEAALAALRRGVPVKATLLAAAEVELLPEAPELPPRSQSPTALPRSLDDKTQSPGQGRGTPVTAWLRIVLREGKKRQIRHMTAAIGHPTLRLVRVAIGPLTARGLEPGQWRELTEHELADLRTA